jgi:CRP/FNR family cyclic AMP-dependent transcriptional regulator
MEAIGHATNLTRCSRGSVILSPDDPPERIHILKQGRVRLYRITPDGKQLTLDLLDPGTVLGDMRVLGQGRISEAFAEALGEAVVCTIAADEMRTLIERYPVIGLNVIDHLARRLREAEGELESMAYESVGQRLARRLVDLADRYGDAGPDGAVVIGQRLTQQELAELVGTSRETLAHLIADLRRRGVIETRDRAFVIMDRRELVAIASGDIG